jgi:hypothetical protein
MKAMHRTTIHARCPFAPVWDYYSVQIETKDFIRCEKIEAICEEIRGQQISQEMVLELLRKKLNIECKITVKGRHGQNGRLVVVE